MFEIWGGHLDTHFEGVVFPLCPFGYVLSFLVLILFLPFLLTFMVVFGVVRAMFLHCALHGVEASYLSKGVSFEVACCYYACCLVSKAAAC